jgi:hypothetical protein
VRSAINRALLRADHYVGWIGSDGIVHDEVVQDTADLVLAQIPPPAAERALLDGFRHLDRAVGHGIVYPTYPPEATGPTPLSAGEYHNGGVWPWMTGLEAWAHYGSGEVAGGDRLLRRIHALSPAAIHEWHHGDTGVGHNPGFATGAAAIICALDARQRYIESEPAAQPRPSRSRPLRGTII